MQARIVKTGVYLNTSSADHSFTVSVPEGAFVAAADLSDGELGLVVMSDFHTADEMRSFRVFYGSGDVYINDDSIYIGSVTVVDYGNYTSGPHLVTMTNGSADQDLYHSHDFNVPEIVTKTFHVIEVT